MMDISLGVFLGFALLYLVALVAYLVWLLGVLIRLLARNDEIGAFIDLSRSLEGSDYWAVGALIDARQAAIKRDMAAVNIRRVVTLGVLR